MKKFIHSLTFLLLANTLLGQQYPLFTNFVTNSFGFNPAIAGAEEGVELRTIYRDQWTGFKNAPRTAIGAASGRFKSIPLGVGGYAYSDKSGFLDRTGFTGILSVHQKMGKNTQASFGLSIGSSRFRLRPGYLVEDLNDRYLANAESGIRTTEMNVGLLLRHQGLTVGFSIPQVIEKPLDFSGIPDATSQSALIRHYYGMASYRHYLGKMYIEPAALVKISEAAPTQIDASVRFGTGTPLWVGASYRNKVAATGMIGIDLESGLRLAYAADLTTTKLSKAGLTSHELTLIYGFGKVKDRDGDGVPDKDDKCPDEPGPFEKDGCPEKKTDKCKDQDKDGICDVDDDCPDLPGPKSNKGCPIDDRDGDGVPDKDDLCPDEPGFKAYNGCPMNDRDKDGLRDDLDKCPDEAGPVSNFGCPVSKTDTDGDGILDEFDQCPNTPGPKENNGCPSVTPDQRAALNLAIQNLYFDTDKWIIKPQSKPHLDKLAKLMVAERDWKVRLSGHADARGRDDHNLQLSKNRAEAVMYYLMSKGVKREQLVVEYYGSKMPVDSNGNPSGLAANRRVEMEFVFD